MKDVNMKDIENISAELEEMIITYELANINQLKNFNVFDLLYYGHPLSDILNFQKEIARLIHIYGATESSDIISPKKLLENEALHQQLLNPIEEQKVTTIEVEEKIVEKTESDSLDKISKSVIREIGEIPLTELGNIFGRTKIVQLMNEGMNTIIDLKTNTKFFYTLCSEETLESLNLRIERIAEIYAKLENEKLRNLFINVMFKGKHNDVYSPRFINRCIEEFGYLHVKAKLTTLEKNEKLQRENVVLNAKSKEGENALNRMYKKAMIKQLPDTLHLAINRLDGLYSKFNVEKAEELHIDDVTALKNMKDETFDILFAGWKNSDFKAFKERIELLLALRLGTLQHQHLRAYVKQLQVADIHKSTDFCYIPRLVNFIKQLSQEEILNLLTKEKAMKGVN